MKESAKEVAEVAVIALLLEMLASVGKAVYTLLEMPLLFILYGYCLSVMWTWFIVAIFHAPPLSIAAAIGVAVTVKLVTKGAPKNLEMKPFGQRVKETALIAIFTLSSVGIGYVAKLFM